jgi:hypothetical protein
MTSVYADYAPDPSQGARWAGATFGVGTISGTNLSATELKTKQEKSLR